MIGQDIFKPTLKAVIIMLSIGLFSIPVIAQAEKSDKDRKPVPSIRITLVPPRGEGPDSMGTIGGVVTGVNFNECRVVVFAHTDKYYVQPYVSAPYTSINEKGRWETETHLGYEYVALLVKSEYKPPPTSQALPDIGGNVLAIATTAANERSMSNAAAVRNEGVRIIQFSGYNWKVKSSGNRVGPGDNFFSDDKRSVEVDAQGRLHLRVTNREGRWLCSEIISEQSFGHGTYRFYIDSVLDNLDPRAVLGLFTWNDDPAFAHREIDIEVSRWGQTDNENAQFVIQPYTLPKNLVRFQIPTGLFSSVHSFTWKPESVTVTSAKGREGSPQSGDIIKQHIFTENIPRPGGENARINLWLISGKPPASGKEIEIIISKFQFIPLP